MIGLLSGLRRALRQRVGRVGDTAGLSDAQRELVRTVSRRPGIRVGEAAGELRLAANTVSTLVTSLCAAGWLIRETDPGDARSALLRLTPEAEARVGAWRDRRLAALSAALAALPAPDRERIERALPALRRTLDLLEGPA
jgi:DNA-binding MarR family transcriptional regulator